MQLLFKVCTVPVIFKHFSDWYRGIIQHCYWNHPQVNTIVPITMTSNGCRGISNHRQINCLFDHLFRQTSNATSNLYLTGPLWGESSGECWLVDSPHKELIIQKGFAYLDVIMPHRWQVNIGLGNGLGLSGNKPLPELSSLGRDESTKLVGTNIYNHKCCTLHEFWVSIISKLTFYVFSEKWLWLIASFMSWWYLCEQRPTMP